MYGVKQLLNMTGIQKISASVIRTCTTKALLFSACPALSY